MRKQDFVSKRLLDTDERFESQYGMVTNRRWILMETGRLPGTRLVELGNREIALVRMKGD